MRGDLAEVAALPMGTFMMATPVILQGEWQIIAGQLRRRRREGEALCFESDGYAAAVKIAAMQDKIAAVAAR